jgi:hypothetical protein
VPKVSSLDEGRKTIPSFAGNTQFGAIDPEMKTLQQAQSAFPPQRQQQPQQQQAFPQQQQQQGFPRQQQQAFSQQQQQQAFPQQQQGFPQQQQQQAFPQQQQQQQPFQQGLNTFQTGNPASQPLSLFDQIKNKINQGNRQQQQQPAQAPPPQQQLAQAPPPQQQLAQAAPPQQQASGQLRPQQQQLPTPGQQTFGPFEAVSLNNALQGSERPRIVASPRSRLVDRYAFLLEAFLLVGFPLVGLSVVRPYPW